MIEVRDKTSVPLSQGMAVDLGDGSPASSSPDPIDIRSWKSFLAGDMNRAISQGRWSSALMVIAWVHLLCFLVCHVLYHPSVQSDMRHPVLWALELLVVLAVMWRVIGPGWYRTAPAISLVVRLWITFLILSFNLAVLNTLTGFEHDWFKPVWGTLSTFLFASLAWLFTPRFLILAVQMWVTGLLMVKFPGWNYLIYGISWWMALMGIALCLQQKEVSRPE
jgi:hypothetical protein